jgi:hypothetical protein
MKISNILICNFVFFYSLFTCKAETTEERTQKIKKVFEKTTKQKQALEILNELIHKNENLDQNPVILNHLLKMNWKNSFKLALENLYQVTNKNKIINKSNMEEIRNLTSTFVDNAREDINSLKESLGKKKKDIVRISPIFEWSQDDNDIKIRIRFAKNLESPGEKVISNFKVNCTRSQLEVQAYKELPDYVVHYYRRLNLYEFIRPYSCSNYKENEGTYIIHFKKNQATLFWNFLNQPSEDHYNLYTWLAVHEKYDDKVQYTDFREHAMENLLISDLEDYKNENMAEKNRRKRKINKCKNFLENKDKENKNYCLGPADKNFCYIPVVTEWGYWLN